MMCHFNTVTRHAWGHRYGCEGILVEHIPAKWTAYQAFYAKRLKWKQF